jgi:hypothetical protein
MRETASRTTGPFMFKRIFRRRKWSLADCPACGADFVHPVEWSPDDEENWWMLLRCGSCHTSREEIVSNLDAARFDADLDLAEMSMRSHAESLSQERLSEEVERFATALALDLIGAEDFSRS